MEDTNVYRTFTLLLISLLITGSVIGIIVPAGLGWDFANFYDAGRKAAAGEIDNLYDSSAFIDGNPPQGSLKFYGAPISAYLYAPFAMFKPETALILFKIQSTVCLFFALLILYFENKRSTDRSGKNPWQFAALFTFLALIFQPFWSIYRVGGQTTPLVLLLFTGSLYFYVRSRDFLSSLLMILAVLIKPAFGISFAFLLSVSGQSFLKKSVFGILIFLLISLSLAGWEIHKKFLIQMLAGMKTTYAWYYNSSIYQPLETLHDLKSPIYAYLLLLSRLSVFASILIWLFRSRKLTCRSGEKHFKFLLAVLLCLLLPPNIWEHYLSLLFLPLAYWIANRSVFTSFGRFLLYSIFFFCLGQNIIFTLFVRQYIDASQSLQLLARVLKSAPLLLTFVFVWKQYRRLLKTYESGETDLSPATL